MVCSACGTENDAGRRFCDTCGAPLAVACRVCGSPNRPTARFCGDCGTALDASGAAPLRTIPLEAAAAQAERRHVSVLFVDLVGYTTLADGWDPEQASDLLTRYFEIARDIVTRYGGTIEKFIGDAVMAVWGAPTAHEDDAERAVRAALDLVAAVPGLDEALRARAGVLTGEAAVTLGAEGQGMVAGDLVNTASRLQSVAPPGTVLVDEATERTASKAIAFEPAGEQLLKGKASPVPAYRAMRVVAERGGRKRSETLEAPFTGRDTELRLLKDLHVATTREHRIRLVSLTGQAGVGKSRLVWEFEKYLDGLVDEIYWNVGRSPAYGDGVTFWALGEMVRGRAGLLATDDEGTTRRKIAESVATVASDDAERRWVETALLTLLAVEPAPPGGRESLFAAWRTYFERLAADSPAVLVFEDLHWADPGLLDFIDHMLEWSTGVPILIVTLARPELLERRPAWGAARRNFIALHLDPLSDASVGEMLDGLVAGLPERAAETIIRRADGIPLYAVETVRMLVADDRLAERDGRYVPVGDLAELAVPETLHALIAARLDALDPTDGSSCRTPPCSARASRRRDWRPSPRPTWPISNRDFAASSVARSSPCRATRGRPNGANTASSRHSFARSRIRRWPSAIAALDTWLQPGSSSRSAKTSLSGPSPPTTWPRSSRLRPVLRRTPSARRRGSRCVQPRNGRPPSAPMSRL